MSTITIHDAQARLADLIHGLSPGEELTITENDRPVARLVTVPAAEVARPVPGRCQGMLTILREDDEHLKDWARVLAMRLLLDTHTLLWFALNDPSLSATAMKLILDPANEKFVSPASYWEIAIKISVGKYSLTSPFEDFFRGAIDDNGFHYLHIEPRHTAALTTLPYHHRDPFDRLIAATALVEGLTLVSADTAFDAYGVTRLW